jgi:outer membrane protein TolC
LQFPGKGLLQGRSAERTAEVAHLTYLAAVRDVTAQAKTAYYQIQLDKELGRLLSQNAFRLYAIREFSRTSHPANGTKESDYLNAQFASQAASELLRQNRVIVSNDKTALNVLMDRPPDEPLPVDPAFDLNGFETSLDQVITRATASRQEILEAALAERNEDSAVMLARLEYAPDYTLGLGFDHWLIGSFAPQPNHTETWNFSIGFNLPVFFWAKNEDIARARDDLDAARENLEAIRTQTAGQVTVLYKQIESARQTARYYRDTLIPLADQAYELMFAEYKKGDTDFPTLFGVLNQQSGAQATYLQAVNQVLAQKVALEQAAGADLQ